MMNGSSDMRTVARLLLDSVQQMDAASYRTIAHAIDYRMALDMQGDADDRDLRDLALLAHAMRLIMTERAVTSEPINPDLERVRTLYNDAKPELLRIVQEFGGDIDAPRPLHALSMHIQLGAWPLEGRDRDIVTALAQACPEMMTTRPTARPSHPVGRAGR